jgi:dipeptidyl aminopeptidase/acylaminoacyl peptidase
MLLRRIFAAKRIGAVLFGLAALTGAPRAICADAPLRLEQYLSWETVLAPQISPDGRSIVYSRSRTNALDDRFDDELWLMDADGHDDHRLAAGRQAIWSPDGTRIAYVSTIEGREEIFVRHMSAAQDVVQVTRGADHPADLSWSPDGAWLAFRSVAASKPQWTIELPRPDGAHWTEDPLVTDRLQFRDARVGVRKGNKHIFIVPATGGDARQLTQGAFEVAALYTVVDFSGRLTWTADGKTILFSANTDQDADLQFRSSAIHAVDVASGSIRKLTRTPGFWLEPSLAPDGRTLAFWGSTDSAAAYPPRQLRIATIDGANERTLVADLPGDVRYLDWAPDGRGLYYVVEREGSRNLHYTALDGTTRAVTAGAQALVISSMSSSGMVAGTRATTDKPEDVIRFKLSDARNIRQLTAVNDDVLREVQLGRVEELWYPSSDQTRVQGWVMYPPGFDATKKYPLILYIHGGPHMMYDVAFSFRFQEMAANGYVLLYVNPRGSTGYGSAFANAIDNAYPGSDVEDLMSAVDVVAKRSYIDPRRLYVTGCSGGGLLTNWIVGHTTRFAAAASLCSISNWLSFAGTADTKMWPYSTIRPAIWENAQHWLERSPLIYAAKVRTPTLLMSGENDLRTVPGQAEEFYAALKLNNVPTRLILLKNQNHGWPTIPSNFMRAQLYLRKWFAEWTRPDDAQNAAWK